MRVLVVFGLLLMVGGVVFGVMHRAWVTKAVVDFLSPIVHEQRPNEADVDYLARMGVLAEKGDVLAQASMGLCKFRGWGCEKNLPEAVAWYTKAAAQGNLGAMNDLAFCYLHGFGVEKNPTLGFQWAMKAAERGHAASQTLVGECYLDGLGVEADLARGEMWLYGSPRT